MPTRLMKLVQIEQYLSKWIASPITGENFWELRILHAGVLLFIILVRARLGKQKTFKSTLKWCSANHSHCTRRKYNNKLKINDGLKRHTGQYSPHLMEPDGSWPWDLRSLGHYWTSWTLKMEPIGCLETSVQNYHTTLRNTPEERIPHLHRGGRMQSRSLPFCKIPSLDHILNQKSPVESRLFSFLSIHFNIILPSTITSSKRPVTSSLLCANIFRQHPALNSINVRPSYYPHKTIATIIDLCILIFMCLDIVCEAMHWRVTVQPWLPGRQLFSSRYDRKYAKHERHTSRTGGSGIA
jgi:hypothetical protein